MLAPVLHRSISKSPSSRHFAKFNSIHNSLKTHWLNLAMRQRQLVRMMKHRMQQPMDRHYAHRQQNRPAVVVQRVEDLVLRVSAVHLVAAALTEIKLFSHRQVDAMFHDLSLVIRRQPNRIRFNRKQIYQRHTYKNKTTMKMMRTISMSRKPFNVFTFCGKFCGTISLPLPKHKFLFIALFTERRFCRKWSTTCQRWKRPMANKPFRSCKSF